MTAEQYRSTGRPLIDPMNKMSVPFRCLITPRVQAACLEAMGKTGLNQSDLLHLFIHEGLTRRGLLPPELTNEDQTFKVLREVGLV